MRLVFARCTSHYSAVALGGPERTLRHVWFPEEPRLPLALPHPLLWTHLCSAPVPISPHSAFKSGKLFPFFLLWSKQVNKGGKTVCTICFSCSRKGVCVPRSWSDKSVMKMSWFHKCQRLFIGGGHGHVGGYPKLRGNVCRRAQAPLGQPAGL